MRLAVLMPALALLLSLPLGGCTSVEEVEEETESGEDALVSCRPLPASWMKTKRISVGGAQVRVGEARPQATPVADILYMHGFADRLDNHKPLFDEWTRRGARVVSFEYPSHGESCGAGLGRYGITGLVEMATEVEKQTSEDRNRPLFVAGWSTGGLIATRLAQGYRTLSRPIAGAMLFAPGVDVHVVLGKVTLESLTSNPRPPHTGPISPTRPALYVAFSSTLLHQAREAREESFPATTPAIVFTGGDATDTYADTSGVEQWVRDKRSEGANITGVSCAGGRHELDNEAEPMGQAVRSAAAEFLSATLRRVAYTAPTSGACTASE